MKKKESNPQPCLDEARSPIASARLRLWTAHLPEPAPARRARVHTRRGVELEVSLEDGRTGRGDISPLPGLHRESLDASIAGIEATFALVRGLEIGQCGTEALNHLCPSAEFCDVVDERLKELPAAAWGLTTAVLDAAGAFSQTPAAARAVLIADDLESLDAQVDSAKRALAAKAKLPRDSALACARIELLRERLGDQVELRFDCGGAFDLDDARKVANAAKTQGATLIEEPAKTLDGNLQLAAERIVPIALDESLVDMFDVHQEIDDDKAAVAESDAADAHLVIAMKPAWLGAKRTRRLIAFARDHRMPIVVSSVYEPPFAREQLAQIQRATDPSTIAGLASGWDLDCTMGDRVVELVR